MAHGCPAGLKKGASARWSLAGVLGNLQRLDNLIETLPIAIEFRSGHAAKKQREGISVRIQVRYSDIFRPSCVKSAMQLNAGCPPTDRA
jgi:hypothetical protein